MPISIIKMLLIKAIKFCAPFLRPFFQYQLTLIENGETPTDEAIKNLIKYLTPIKNKLDKIEKDALEATERRRNREKEAKINYIKTLINLAAYYQDNHETVEAGEILERFLKDLGYTSGEKTGTGTKRGTIAAPGKLKRLLKEYIKHNKQWMDDYKNLLDKCFSIVIEDDKFIVKSTFGSLKHSEYTTLKDAKQYVKTLKTGHLQNNFCKDKKRLRFDELTQEFINTKFKKVI